MALQGDPTAGYRFRDEQEAAAWRSGVVADIRSIQTDIKTILREMVTRPEMNRALDSKADRDESRTYRGWQDDRYQQMREAPREARDIRYSRNIDLQTLLMTLAFVLSLLASFGVRL